MTRRVLVEREDRLDRIARTLYGDERGGTVEALLDANPGLAAGAGTVAAGTILTVPEAAPEAASAIVRPWI